MRTSDYEISETDSRLQIFLTFERGVNRLRAMLIFQTTNNFATRWPASTGTIFGRQNC